MAPNTFEAEREWVADVMGQEPCAVVVAANYARATSVVMADEYRKAGMASLKHHQQVSAKVFHLLVSDTQSAKVDSMLPFSLT